eukprot:scaffold167347_cov52-Prasinocladus_malaysianus.AAC.1
MAVSLGPNLHDRQSPASLPRSPARPPYIPLRCRILSSSKRQDSVSILLLSIVFGNPSPPKQNIGIKTISSISIGDIMPPLRHLQVSWQCCLYAYSLKVPCGWNNMEEQLYARHGESECCAAVVGPLYEIQLSQHRPPAALKVYGLAPPVLEVPKQHSIFN